MTWVNILAFVLILMALVLVHEAGHFVVARWCGMRVERFSIFFGRPLVSFRRNETEYRIGWLPLGGYVKISGMTREELASETPRRTAGAAAAPPPASDESLVRRAYFAQRPWKRIVTIAAGPAVNIALAYVIFVIAFGIGPREILPANPIEVVDRGSPAAQIGLRPGDRIVAVNGVPAGDGLEAVRKELQAHPGRSVVVRFERGDQIRERRVTLRSVEVGGATIGQLGVRFATVQGERRSSGFPGALVDGGDFTVSLVEENFRALGRVFTDQRAREEIGTVVGIGAVYDDVADEGLLTVLRYVGYISLILGIFNLLPLLPLDGGHILFTLIEKLKGSAVSRAVYERASMVGLALLLLVFVVALQNDIGRLTGEGFDTGR